jgi:hypothetical protein
MKSFRSSPAIALAVVAMLSMASSPAMARGWRGHHHRHHDRVDAGDVLAGILIIGGIAAIASAASKSNRERRERERDSDYRYPDRDYRGDRDYDAPSHRYGDDPRRGSYYGSRGGMDGAAEICVDEVERGDSRVDTVEQVSREDFGWRVEGRLAGGRDYSCIVDHDHRIRRVTVDGKAII